MAKRRETNVFSLSFLDIMSCGFGAVILIYIIINHATERTSQELNAQMLAEVRKVEEQVEDETEHLISLRNTARAQEDELVTTRDLSRQILDTIAVLQAELAVLQEAGASQDETIEQLKAELKQLEADQREAAVAEEDAGEALRAIAGAGDRQYLTGVNVGGEHILILLDASASMLDKTIVNVIRRRNLPEQQQRHSEKWQRAIRTVEWIIANMPRDSQFQLFTFNAGVAPAITGTASDWLQAAEQADTDRVLDSLKATTPEGGTSLHQAFTLMRRLAPQPDNIFLIVDSLPTLGMAPARQNVIDGRDRLELFTDSLTLLPQQAIPVNVILFPMEGDPIAAPSYWRLAQFTGGSFMAPPEDWP